MKWTAPCISDVNLSAFSLSFPTTSHYVRSSQSSRAIFTGEVINSNGKHICEAFHSFWLTFCAFIAEKMLYGIHTCCVAICCSLSISPCLSALNVWYIKPTVFAPFPSFRHNSALHQSVLGPNSHMMVFFNLLLHVQTRLIYAGKQALVAVIKCTNAKSHTERCSTLLAPSLSFHVHASADVITLSAAGAVQRCETKSRSPPSIIKSFLAIGQLTLASRTVPFHFHQSCHPHRKRGKDCQMILARSHHSQPLIVWSSELRLETLLYVRLFCEVSRLCCQLQAIWFKSWLFHVTLHPHLQQNLQEVKTNWQTPAVSALAGPQTFPCTYLVS